jgi:D-alanyl-D-alanine carboxypeptidase (penicillin-binding protein 5/6)
VRGGRSRGRAARLAGALLGALAAGALVCATQLPLAYAAAGVDIRTGSFAASTTSPRAFVWPTDASAAVAVPALHVAATSPLQPVQPIASLTKMMTAYVTLSMLPLIAGQSGPCETVTGAQVALYDEDQETDQSSVKVVAGTTLCELDLLKGLFVHSANNYAEMLVQMTGLSEGAFISQMNETAARLAMVHTHYHDVSGFDPASVSTAGDQLILVQQLMQDPLVRSIVRKRSVNLPGAGVVRTYTPLLGTHGVVGVKSGFTSQAGGCDVLALARTEGGISFLTFAVVLGERTGDVLELAGDAADALAVSAADQVVATTYHSGEVVGTLGWRGARTTLILARTTRALWWQHTPTVSVTVAPYASAGAPVSWSRAPAEPRTLVTWTSAPGVWHTAYSAAGTIPGGTVVGDVRFAGDPDLFMVILSSHPIVRPPWWNGLL